MRISGVNIPQQKPVFVALTSIYGVGVHTSLKLCGVSGIEPSLRVRDLTSDQVRALQDNLLEYKVEGALRRYNYECISRLISIRSYRGKRHELGLPQKSRTHSNARTARRCSKLRGFGSK